MAGAEEHGGSCRGRSRWCRLNIWWCPEGVGVSCFAGCNEGTWQAAW